MISKPMYSKVILTEEEKEILRNAYNICSTFNGRYNYNMNGQVIEWLFWEDKWEEDIVQILKYLTTNVITKED